MKTDFKFHNHGSVAVLIPMNETAQAWLADNIDLNSAMSWAGGVVIEPRYTDDIICGLQADGLTVAA